MSTLKEVYKSDKKQPIIQEIKSKLNVIIEKDDSDSSDFTSAADHDYDLPAGLDCLMYFVTGHVCKNLAKFTTCEICSSAFFYSEEDTLQIQNHPLAKLITFDEDQKLRHPNKGLFNFLKDVEASFVKHCNNTNVFDLVVCEITQQTFKFPCSEHATDVLSYLLDFYLQNRMRQYAKTKMAHEKKQNLQKKKAANLVTS